MWSTVFFHSVSFLLIVLPSACSVNVEPEKTPESAPTYADTNLRGKIWGHAWEFGTGRIDGNSDDSTLSFTLVSSTIGNACEKFILNGDDKLSVRFDVEARELVEERYPLGLGQKTVSLIEGTDTDGRGSIALQGFFEFIAVDADKVAGKMVAFVDATNVVNGNFEVVRCCTDEETGNSETCNSPH
ncbi:MAG: hypothetical protein AB7T49_10860 [Oligoflexales bacterium]